MKQVNILINLVKPLKLYFSNYIKIIKKSLNFSWVNRSINDSNSESTYCELLKYKKSDVCNNYDL